MSQFDIQIDQISLAMKLTHTKCISNYVFIDHGIKNKQNKRELKTYLRVKQCSISMESIHFLPRINLHSYIVNHVHD